MQSYDLWTAVHSHSRRSGAVSLRRKARNGLGRRARGWMMSLGLLASQEPSRIVSRDRIGGTGAIAPVRRLPSDMIVLQSHRSGDVKARVPGSTLRCRRGTTVQGPTWEGRGSPDQARSRWSVRSAKSGQYPGSRRCVEMHGTRANDSVDAGPAVDQAAAGDRRREPGHFVLRPIPLRSQGPY